MLRCNWFYLNYVPLLSLAGKLPQVEIYYETEEWLETLWERACPRKE